MATEHGPNGREGVPRRDVVAILLLVFGMLGGAVLFVLVPPLIPVAAGGAYFTGLVLLWTSGSFTNGERLATMLVWPGGVATPLLLGTMATRVCTTVEELRGDEVVATTTCEGFALPAAVGIPLGLVLVAAPIVVGAIVLRRANRRIRAGATGIASR